MDKPSPFLIYAVTNAEGRMEHSSIFYDDSLKLGVQPTDDEFREMLLTSASYASQEFEWPEHGSDKKNDYVLSLYGPFFPGKAADKVTGAEYHAIDEGQLP